MENALRAKPKDVQELYESQLKDLQEAYGEAMLELPRRSVVYRAVKAKPRVQEKFVAPIKQLI
jgi:hypothetical protein